MIRNTGSGNDHEIPATWTFHDKPSSAPCIDRNGNIIYPDRLQAIARSRLQAMPDVRPDVAEKVRRLLEDGCYEVAGREVAIHIVINALAERHW